MYYPIITFFQLLANQDSRTLISYNVKTIDLFRQMIEENLFTK